MELPMYAWLPEEPGSGWKAKAKWAVRRDQALRALERLRDSVSGWTPRPAGNLPAHPVQ